MPHVKNDNSRDPAGSRCRNCQATSRNSRGSEGILISSIQDRKQQHLLHFPFHSFVLLSRCRFRPVPPVSPRFALVHLRVLYTRVYTCPDDTSPRDPEYHHSSRFLNSLRLLSYFPERKTSTIVAHSVSASIVSASCFFDIYLSFVRIFHLFYPSLPSTFFFFRSHRALCPRFLISYILFLDARTLKRISNFGVAEDVGKHVRPFLRPSRSRNPFEISKRVWKRRRSVFPPIKRKNFLVKNGDVKREKFWRGGKWWDFLVSDHKSVSNGNKDFERMECAVRRKTFLYYFFSIILFPDRDDSCIDDRYGARAAD